MLADELGIPSLFLSGDKGICSDASAQYPGIVTVATKEGIGNGTWNLHPEDVNEQIEQRITEFCPIRFRKQKL